MKNCPCEAGDSLLEGQTTTGNLIGSINRNMNILADSSNTRQVNKDPLFTLLKSETLEKEIPEMVFCGSD